MRQIIAISGSSGGNSGPQGVYSELQSHYQDETLSVSRLDTSPDEIDENVKKVLKAAEKADEVYLMGYSMGGAVAASAAGQLGDKLKGVVLLNTQTEGLYCLKNLNVPVLFYHGSEDEYFPKWQVEGLFKGYSGPKKWVELEGLNHGFRSSSGQYTQSLASELHSEISHFFFEGSYIEENGTEITKSLPADPSVLRKLISWIF
jgi:pimeloyl-ACP methyl ester carboxylesterase